MNITLYKTKSENNRVNKAIREPLNLTGNIKDECDVLNPVITFELSDPTVYNYVYIEEFHRYYFIVDTVNVRNNIWNLSLKCDVLFTYRNEIKKLSAVIEKQEGSKYTTEYYNDGSFKVREDNFIEVYNFDNGFNDNGEFILLTAGAISGGN